MRHEEVQIRTQVRQIKLDFIVKPASCFTVIYIGL